MDHLNRVEPNLPARAYKTYELAAPLTTHYRRASCAEVACPHHLHGWATTVVAGSQDEAIIRAAGRHFTAEDIDGGFRRFVFPPGQLCFKASTHVLPLEREPLYLVHGGDWRGNPLRLPTRRHANGTDWVDDFGEHQQRIADQIERG